MADNSDPTPNRKLALLAPLAIILAAGAIVLFALLGRAPPAPPSPQPVTPASAPVAPPPPLAAEPPLDRAALIAAGRQAAADYAAGAKPGSARNPLIGRAFVLRLPFGCDGPQASAGASQAYYSYDAPRKSIRVSARPAIWTTLPQIQSLPDVSEIEAVEGFWLSRPWTASESCPPRSEGPPPASPTPPASDTLGLAQLFSAEGSRVLRRGERPYEITRRVGDDDAALVSRSYRLVLEGRISGFPDGRAARCWAETPDHRPVCLLGVTFERVAILDGATGEVLGEWRD